MKKKICNVILYFILILCVMVFVAPILFILMNSFKGKLYISDAPFALPTADTFAALTNYANGIEKTGFFSAFGWSCFITIGAVFCILLFTSMTAYYLCHEM